MRRVAGARELLDGDLDPRTLRANMRDLARVNRLLGGTAVTWRALQPFLQRRAGGQRLRMLDVGTGLADIPHSLLRRAGRHDLLEIVALDVRPEIVALARAANVGVSHLEIGLAQPDAIAEPTGSFDVAHASLVLHHLEPEACVGLMRELARVATRAVIVNDLDRRRRWWLAAWLMSHALTLNRYTRHDAPLSVKRAYRPSELVRMASAAGLVEERRYWTRPAYRYAIVFRHAATARA